jgi:hypothetical protein
MSTDISNLKVCDNGVLIKLLSFWTLSIVLFFYLKQNVSETEFSLRLLVKAYSVGPRIQCPKRFILIKKTGR